MPRLLIVGNWKMNGTRSDMAEIEAIRAGVLASSSLDVVVCPPMTLVGTAAQVMDGCAVEVGAQDCSARPNGAYTGDISSSMLRDAGATWVIVGHSERRSGHGETSTMVRAKGDAALAAGLSLIICVGETMGERAAGLAEMVTLRQIKDSVPAGAMPENTVIAYEPVWAIGTGVVPQVRDIETVHRVLRRFLEARSDKWRLLYGGSVTPTNTADILQSGEVDGALVGGASLKAQSFLAIVKAGEEAASRRMTKI